MQKYGLNSLIILVLFIVTAQTYTYTEAIDNGFSDIKAYYFMAENGFVENASKEFTQHHLERWVLNVIVGSIAHTFSIDIWAVYMGAVLFCMLAVVFLINFLNWDDKRKIIALVLVIYNPYTFRLYYSAPGMINDCVFYTAIVGLIVGTLKRNNWLIIFAVIIASLSRQSSVLLIPVLVIFYLYKHISYKLSLILASELVVVFLTNKLLTEQLFGGSEGGYFMAHALGIYFWVVEGMSWKDGIAFFGRYVFFLLGLLPIILVTGKNYSIYLVFVVSFLLLHSQPIAGGPLITGGNIQRLSAFGIPFLIPLLAENTQIKRQLLFVLIFILMSMHHHFSVMIYITNDFTLFGFIVVLGAFVSLISHKLIKL
jgi:hypothetical protein